MKVVITKTILSHLAKQISNGKPLWGLIWANEYLEEDNGIRKALVRKAQRALSEQTIQSELFQSIAQGQTMAELSPHLQAELAAINERVEIKRRIVIIPNRKISTRVERIRAARMS